MKNEKIVEVCKVVIQVCNIANLIAQTLVNAFAPSLAHKSPSQYSQEDIKLIKEFMEQENIK